MWLVKENGYFWSCKYCKWLNNFQKRNIEMLNLHFFSSINSIIFSCFTQKGKCYNHSSSYLFLLRYAEIQKGKCNNDFFILPVSFTHTFSMRWTNVFIDNLLPPTTAKPTSEKTLNLFNLGNVRILFLVAFFPTKVN